jgi:hypothetical protein
MTEPHHTMGPWAYLDLGEVVLANDFDVTVATLNTTHDDAEAAGELLAAAPELLDALRNARIILAAMRHAGEGGLDTVIEEADAAISKASAR